MSTRLCTKTMTTTRWVLTRRFVSSFVTTNRGGSWRLFQSRDCLRLPKQLLHQHHRQQQSYRSISTTYLLDTLLQRPNPLLEHIKQQQRPSNDSDNDNENIKDDDTSRSTTNDIDTRHIPPYFQRLEPFHAPAATLPVMQQFDNDLQQLQRNLVDDMDNFEERYQDVLAPVQQLEQTLGFLSLVSDATTTMDWKRAHQAAVEQRRDVERRHATWMYQHLTRPGISETFNDNGSIPRLVTYLEEMYAARWSDTDDLELKTKYETLQEAEQTCHLQLNQDIDGNRITKDTLRLMYNTVGLAHDKARLLGYEHRAAQVLRQRMATWEEIQSLHQETRRQVMGESEIPSISSPDLLKDYLSNDNQNNSNTSNDINDYTSSEERDERAMLRLERYVTLDGAMDFLNHFLQTLFSVQLVRDHNVSAWDEHVQLYHVLDTSSSQSSQSTTPRHVGSFYVDPFARVGKHDRPCVVSLQPGVVALLLQLEVPTWDTDPATLRWLDLVQLFHEMGHVLQHVLGSSNGQEAHHTPRDAHEILPSFMEKWLLEPSTLHGLMAASQMAHPNHAWPAPPPEDMDAALEALYRVVSRQKAQQLSLQMYLATLEMTLFGGFDLRGSESIMALQQRLAEEWAPQELPAPQDYTPLIQVLQLNASPHVSDPVGYYSYLWADALSAVVFARVKEAHQTKQENGGDASAFTALRRVLLHPGAVVTSSALREEYEIGDCVSPHELLKLYRLLEATKS